MMIITLIRIMMIIEHAGTMSSDAQHPNQDSCNVSTSPKWNVTIAKIDNPPKNTPPASNVVVSVDQRKYHLKRCVEPECIGEYWVMRVVHKKDEANMVLETFTFPIDVVGKSETVIVKVPCAVSTCPISSGAELVLYKPTPKGEDSKTKQVAAVVEPAGKRQRVE